MITSTGNSRVRELVKLKKNSRDRDAQDVFVAEGPKMFREIPVSLLREAYATKSFLESADGRKALSAGIRIETVSDAVFQYMSDTRSPQGILAVVSQLHYEIPDLLGEGNASPDRKEAAGADHTPLIVVLENLQDPGNLGTIVRSAEAAGATGILLSKGSADIYNPKVTRSTMGSVFRVPFVYTDHLKEELEALKERGVRLYAAHLKGSRDMYAESYAGPGAFLIGNESRGLTDETAALAHQAVRIPMCGQVESLNAAIAASVLLYEARRQRQN